MGTVKRTYALPPGVVEEFERAVGSGKRSSVIANLLQNWLVERRRAELRRQVIEGCREMADVYGELERAYHPLEEEVHRGLDSPAG